MLPEQNEYYRDQYLVFLLGEDHYALEITQVREIVMDSRITEVPRLPDYVPGVMNLRGNVISVIDMMKILGLPVREKREGRAIMVTDVNLEDETLTIGLIADSVKGVEEIPANRIGVPPEIGIGIDPAYLHGVAWHAEEIIGILNMEKIVSSKTA